MIYHVKNISGDTIATFKNLKLALFFIEQFVEKNPMLVGEAWIIVKASDDNYFNDSPEKLDKCKNDGGDVDDKVQVERKSSKTRKPRKV